MLVSQSKIEISDGCFIGMWFGQCPSELELFQEVDECGDALRGIGGETKTLAYTNEFSNSFLAHQYPPT